MRSCIILPFATALVILAVALPASGGPKHDAPALDLGCPDGGKLRGYRPVGVSVFLAALADELAVGSRAECVGGQQCCMARDADRRWVQHGPAVSFLADGSPMCRTEWVWGRQTGTTRCWRGDGSIYELHGAPALVEHDATGHAPPRLDGPAPAPQPVAPPAWSPPTESPANAHRLSPEADRTAEATAADSNPPTRETAPSVTLLVTGFSDANAEAIRAQKAGLDERLAFLSDSSGVTAEVALAGGSEGSLVTVQERMTGPLEGLGFVPDLSLAGHRVLSLGRARLVAAYVNARVGVGPVRSAIAEGNVALAEALGKRAVLVQYVNDDGAILNVPFTPTHDGNVSFVGALVVARQGELTEVMRQGELTEVMVDPGTGLLPLPVGADGKPTPAARVYAFFGEPIQ